MRCPELTKRKVTSLQVTSEGEKFLWSPDLDRLQGCSDSMVQEELEQSSITSTALGILCAMSGTDIGHAA